MRYSGLRISDVIALKADKIQNGKVFLHQAKSGQPVWLPLAEESLESPVPMRCGRRPIFFGRTREDKNHDYGVASTVEETVYNSRNRRRARAPVQAYPGKGFVGAGNPA